MHKFNEIPAHLQIKTSLSENLHCKNTVFTITNNVFNVLVQFQVNMLTKNCTLKMITLIHYIFCACQLG